jgi:membrane associated rhomboid family serine protease
MGIYDRDYYRRDGSKFFGALATGGRFTNALIVLNVVCFLLQIMTRSGGEEPFTRALDLDVSALREGQVWRLLTYAFLHDPSSIMHLLFNMLFLFWFGRQVEDRLGGREFLRVYLLAAVAAGLAFVGATLLGFHRGPALGASGAVTATLILAAFYNPRQVIYLFFILPVPIWGFVILSVAMDVFNFADRKEGVATSAHLGGAAFAFCYYKLRWNVGGWFDWLPEWRSRPKTQARLRIYSEEEHEPLHARVSAPRPVAPPRGDDEQLEAQADVILEKIARVGIQGITDSERALLVRASEMMKRRRS